MDDRIIRRTVVRCATVAPLVTMALLQRETGENASGEPVVRPPAVGKYREAPMLAARVVAEKLPFSRQ
jgi:hypothetical protein